MAETRAFDHVAAAGGTNQNSISRTATTGRNIGSNGATSSNRSTIPAIVAETVNSTSVEVILKDYDIGVQVRFAQASGSTLADISERLEQSETHLSACGTFAKAFTRVYVTEQSSSAELFGNPLTVSHWLRLSRIADPEEAKNRVAQTIDEGLTVRNLDELIRSGASRGRHTRGGGRSPAMPKSIIAAIVRASALGNCYSNFVRAGMDAFTNIRDVGPQHLATAVANAEQVIEQAQEWLRFLRGGR